MSDTTAEAATTTIVVPAAAAPVDVSAAVALALTAERTRTAGLDRIAAAHAVPADTLARAKEDGTDVATFALAVADLSSAAVAKAKADKLAALKSDEDLAAEAAASAGEPAVEDSVEATAKAILAA